MPEIPGEEGIKPSRDLFPDGLLFYFMSATLSPGYFFQWPSSVRFMNWVGGEIPTDPFTKPLGPEIAMHYVLFETVDRRILRL